MLLGQSKLNFLKAQTRPEQAIVTYPLWREQFMQVYGGLGMRSMERLHTLERSKTLLQLQLRDLTSLVDERSIVVTLELSYSVPPASYPSQYHLDLRRSMPWILVRKSQDSVSNLASINSKNLP